MNATWWGFLGAAVAVYLEYCYRMWSGTYLQNVAYWIIPYMFVSYCIYKLVTAPQTSLIEAFVIWACSTMILRILVSLFMLHEQSTPGTWTALGLVLAARIVQNYWR